MGKTGSIDHRLVSIGSGQVHCQIFGHGPPLLVIPAGNGPQAIAALVDGLADRFTCFLVDIPGYLLSDPLPMARPEVRNYALAMAALLESLGIIRCAVLGSHTGATIAVDLALARPDLCSSLVLHELSIFSTEQRVDMFQNHLPPYVPDWHGGYLVGFWHRYREQMLFRPWFRKGAQNRLLAAGDDVKSVHDTFLVQAAVGDGYRKCYEAVIGYDVVSGLTALSLPVLVAAPTEAWLTPARSLSGVPVELVPASSAVARYGRALARGNAKRWRSRKDHSGAGERRLVTVGNRRLLVRGFGDVKGPPVLIIPHMPGPALPVADFATSFSQHRVVLAELSGNGDSFRTTENADPELWVDEVEELISTLGLHKPALVGQGTGAVVATAAMTRRLGSRLVLVNPPLLDVTERLAMQARYASPVELTWDGSHLVKLYQALRNEELFWPWYDQAAAGTRKISPPLDRMALDRRLTGILKHYETYAPSWHALLGFPLREAVSELPVKPAIVTVQAHLFSEVSSRGARALKLPARNSDSSPQALALAVSQALTAPKRSKPIVRKKRR